MNVTNLNAQLFCLFVFVLTMWNFLAARDNWHQEDPQLIAEVLFAVTSMLSFTRLAYILPAHESLGTLQISIGKMIDDMMRSFISDCLYFYIWIYKTRSMWMFFSVCFLDLCSYWWSLAPPSFVASTISMFLMSFLQILAGKSRESLRDFTSSFLKAVKSISNLNDLKKFDN